MTDPTRTIPIEALDRADQIQEATTRLVALFKRHGMLHTDPTHPLGLELDEIVREFEQAARRKGTTTLAQTEIEGVAIECGLCCVDGFGKTVCTDYSGTEHVLKFAREIERAARKAAIEECASCIDERAFDESGLCIDPDLSEMADRIRALQEGL
jgi:hypothetical protein